EVCLHQIRIESNRRPIFRHGVVNLAFRRERGSQIKMRQGIIWSLTKGRAAFGDGSLYIAFALEHGPKTVMIITIVRISAEHHLVCGRGPFEISLSLQGLPEAEVCASQIRHQTKCQTELRDGCVIVALRVE